MGHKGPVKKGLRASEPKGLEPIYYSILFCNREQRAIFQPKVKEVTGGWRKLHNGKMHDFDLSQIVIGLRE
jgi:hypothetical protein